MKSLKSFFQLLLLVTCYYCSNAFRSSFHGDQQVLSSSSSSSFPSQQYSSYSSSCWTMKIRIGTLGLPNVGKSTLFNALAKQSIAQAENFPFCTIDPNITPLAIPDQYLEELGTFAKSSRTVPATIEWVDVAGLAKGAHRGEGLGNRFLGTLRECRALCHMTRIFQDDGVVHVDGVVDPVSDMEAISLELLYADMAHVERRLEKRDKIKIEELTVLERVLEGLKQGKPARALNLSREDKFHIRSMGLLTLKPILHTFNVDEVDYVLDREKIMETIERDILSKVEYCFDANTDMWTLVSAKVEADIATLTAEEQEEYFELLGVQDFDQGLLCYNLIPTLITQLLGMTIVYTGPGVPPEKSKTTRAHLVSSGRLSAQGLAGRIHGDIERGFIKAEVIPASILLEHKNYVAAKESGSIRSEGKDYELHDKDVVCIKWK